MQIEYTDFETKHVNSRANSVNPDDKFVCNLILNDGMCLDKKLK